MPTAEALIGDPAVDVVVVCTPPDTHFALSKAALTAGKHVLVEKPFVPTASEADELVALARESGRLLGVYQNRRWDGDFNELKTLLDCGVVGDVLEFETHFDRYRPVGGGERAAWKGALGMDAAGGPLYDLGTHLLDQVFTLWGMPNTVWGKFAWQRVSRFRDDSRTENEPDAVTAVLEYWNGGGGVAGTGTGKTLLVLVRIAAMSAEPKQLRFWVRGTRGSYKRWGTDPQEEQLKSGMAVDDGRFGKDDEHGLLALVQDADGGQTKIIEGAYPSASAPYSRSGDPVPMPGPPPTYREFYARFAAALESGLEKDLPVSAAEAADVLRIVEAVKESGRTGKEVRLA